MILRDVTPEFATALKKRRVRIALLAEFELGLTVARFWTRMGRLEWQGVTWYGALGPSPAAGLSKGSVFMGMTNISETSEIKAIQVGFTLAGVPIVDGDNRNLLELVQEYMEYLSLVRVWFALFNLDTAALIADPTQYYEGKIDAASVKPESETFTIVISTNNDLYRLQGSSGLRLTPGSQKKFFPDDRGFDHAARSLHQIDDFG